jgi:hypothetical protein
MKRNIARHRTAASLYRLAFDDVVSDLLKVTAAAVAETPCRSADPAPHLTTAKEPPSDVAAGPRRQILVPISAPLV